MPKGLIRYGERLALIALWLFAGLISGFTPLRAEEPAKTPTLNDRDKIKVAAEAKEFMVPMRDGVKLATNVVLPKEGKGPWPVILTRTPYGKDNRQFGALSMRYGPQGYVYVGQDCRGKFRSDGNYRPFEDDLNDGYDTIKWIASQDFCNGKVGITGASAMGITSNLAASAAPPELKAAYVIVAPSSMFEQSTFQGGVFKDADVGRWMKSNGAGDQVDAIKVRAVMDQRWKETDLPNHITNAHIPIYNVGGWYDIFNQGNINNFVYLQTKGKEGAKGNQKLLMGPFGHGNLSGDIAYTGDGGLMGAVKEELRWWDYWLKGIDNGIMKEPPVKYYQMAAARKGAFSTKNGYKNADAWPLKTKDTRYYLNADFTLATDAPKAANSSTGYDFDPKNPVPSVGGANLTIDRGPKDQREIKDRKDYLRFQTPPLEKDVTVNGQIIAELYASTDAPDTDFMAKLVDVYPDGYEAILLDAPIRARYRNGRNPEDIKMMTSGKPELMKIDLWSTANIFEAGHRIALHVTSSNSPRFEVNPNTGEAPGKSTMEPRVAHNAIHHDAAHPSAVILPIVE